MQPSKWKILTSDYLTHYDYFTARKDCCETTNGKIIPQYYVVELRPCVCALGITENNQAILIRQYRHPVQKTLLEIPGGFVDENEDPLKAIERELKEETGYEFANIEFLAEVAANPGILNNYTKLYLATGGIKVSDQNLDANEDIEIILMPLDELFKMLLDNKLDQSMHINCLFYAFLKLGKLRIN